MIKKGFAMIDIIIILGITALMGFVVLFIAGGKFNIFERTVNQDCAAMGGEPSDSNGGCPPSNKLEYVIPRISKDHGSTDGDKTRCCVKLG